MEEQIVQEDIVKAAQEEAEKAEGSRALYEVKMKFWAVRASSRQC